VAAAVFIFDKFGMGLCAYSGTYSGNCRWAHCRHRFADCPRQRASRVRITLPRLDLIVPE